MPPDSALHDLFRVIFASSTRHLRVIAEIGWQIALDIEAAAPIIVDPLISTLKVRLLIGKISGLLGDLDT